MSHQDDNRFMLHDIKNGLDNDEFIFYYQPKISFMTGRVIGAEALIRWRKESGFIQPNDFIPLAESTGYITVITEKMLPRFVADIVEANTQCGDLSYSFNVSSHDLKVAGFYRQVADIFGAGMLEKNKVIFELTETTLVDMTQQSIHMMHDLHGLGIQLSLDDFGTGYSSLEVLSTFPFSSIKLDKSLVNHICTGNRVTASKGNKIVNSNIRMAQRLGMRIVAEGIEDECTYKKLLYSGCHQGQGFFMSRPLPLNGFIDLVKSGKRWEGKPIGLVYQAQMDHIQWRKDMMELFYHVRNNEFLDDIENEQEFKEMLGDHTECNLGRWYYSDGMDYSEYKSYKELEGYHKNLHRIGNELLRKVIIDRFDESLFGLLERLNALSGEMIRLLQDLENEVHRNSLKPRHEYND
ncbi:MAG: EAL domain-containing protein [Magnetococcus sp. DMHC-1]|nr:EAL domain-containing protein [Magnetococcales bacterium]